MSVAGTRSEIEADSIYIGRIYIATPTSRTPFEKTQRDASICPRNGNLASREEPLMKSVITLGVRFFSIKYRFVIR